MAESRLSGTESYLFRLSFPLAGPHSILYFDNKTEITMQRIILLLSVLILVVTGCGPKTPEQEIRIVLAEMKQRIEQDNIRELITDYYHPREVGDITGKERSELVEDVKNNGRTKEKLQDMYQILTRMESLTPAIEDNNTLAVFDDKSLPETVYFEKVDGRWLIRSR